MKKNKKDWERPWKTEKDWEILWERIINIDEDEKRVRKIEKHYEKE